MRYLLESSDGKELFLDLGEALDYITTDDFYVYNNPTLYRLNSGIDNPFELFLTFRDRLDFEGNEVEYEDRPNDTDHFTFHLYPNPNEWLNVGWLWVDRFNEFKRFRETVLDFAIRLEEKQLIKES